MNNLQKPTRTTLSAQIVEQMENCIRKGIWPIDSRIPGEVELMESFAVSRNTVREATMSLVHAGLLRTQPGDGTYVIGKDRLDVAMMQRFKESDLKDVIEVRLALEVNIVALACKYSSAADMKTLKQILDERQEPDTDIPEFTHRDTAFHLQLARQSHNRLFYDLYKSCISFIEEEINMYLLSSLSESRRQNNEHEELYEAVLLKDELKAVSLVRKIIEGERDEFIRAGML